MPYFINFGREHIAFGDYYQTQLATEQEELVDPNRKSHKLQNAFEDVVRRLKAAHDRSKRRYDLRKRPLTLAEGDQVYRRNHVLSHEATYFMAKLAPRFVGSLRVKCKLSPTPYELIREYGKTDGVWRIRDIKVHPPDE